MNVVYLKQHIGKDAGGSEHYEGAQRMPVIALKSTKFAVFCTSFDNTDHKIITQFFNTTYASALLSYETETVYNVLLLYFFAFFVCLFGE